MKFSKFVSKESILISEATSKRDLLASLIKTGAELAKISEEMVRGLTLQREKMMATGIGNGLALPHIRVTEIPHPVVVVGVCKNEINDYQSQDDKPIRVAVFIIAPEGNQENYLQLLRSVCEKLGNSKAIGEILENITRPSQILRILKRR